MNVKLTDSYICICHTEFHWYLSSQTTTIHREWFKSPATLSIYIYPYLLLLDIVGNVIICNTLWILWLLSFIFVVWYDEMCLIENPYFRATDLNCWACEGVRSVLDLSEMHNPRDFQPHTGFPYIVKVTFHFCLWCWLCGGARQYCGNFEVI